MHRAKTRKLWNIQPHISNSWWRTILCEMNILGGRSQLENSEALAPFFVDTLTMIVSLRRVYFCVFWHDHYDKHDFVNRVMRFLVCIV